MGTLLAWLSPLLQARPMPPPVFYQDVSLWHVLGWAVLDPVVVAIAVAFARHADNPVKRAIVAFGAALGGVVVLWIAAWLGFDVDTARAGAGVFITALPFAYMWVTLARKLPRAI